MTIVKVRHIRQANLCASGTREWFRRHDLDYVDFLKNGIDAEKVLQLNDHFGNQVVANAREEEAQQEVNNG